MKLVCRLAFFVIAGLLFAATARADDRAQAEALFREARTLMLQRRFAEACPKFEQSQRLDPAVGTQLNLARCLKELGQTASAWFMFRQTALAARGAGQAERAAHAEDEAAALRPKLPLVDVRLPADKEDVHVTIDGTAVALATLAEPMPIDPGEHLLRASRGETSFFNHTFTAREGETLKIDVPPPPARAAEPVPVVEPPPPAPSPAPPPKPPAPVAPDAADDSGGLGAQRAAAIVLGSVGLVGVGLGIGFGVKASSTLDESDGFCSSNDVCHDEGIELRDQATTEATISTVGFAVGGAAVVTAIVVYFTAPAREGSARAAGERHGARLSFGATSGGAVLRLGGRF
jgi:hypothetical protein